MWNTTSTMVDPQEVLDKRFPSLPTPHPSKMAGTPRVRGPQRVAKGHAVKMCFLACAQCPLPGVLLLVHFICKLYIITH